MTTIRDLPFSPYPLDNNNPNVNGAGQPPIMPPVPSQPSSFAETAKNWVFSCLTTVQETIINVISSIFQSIVSTCSQVTHWVKQQFVEAEARVRAREAEAAKPKFKDIYVEKFDAIVTALENDLSYDEVLELIDTLVEDIKGCQADRWTEYTLQTIENQTRSYRVQVKTTQAYEKEITENPQHPDIERLKQSHAGSLGVVKHLQKALKDNLQQDGRDTEQYYRLSQR